MERPLAAAADVAGLIYAGFRAYRDEFAALTEAALARFEEARWLDVQAVGAQRLTIYHTHVENVVGGTEDLTPRAFEARLEDWHGIRREYEQLIDDTPDAQLAETFFNSVFREHTNDGPPTEEEMFLTRSIARISTPPDPLIETFIPVDGIVAMVREVLGSFGLSLPWLDIDVDVANILRSLVEERPEITTANDIILEVIKTPFFRNKGVYVVGRLRHGDQAWPLALPILRTDEGSLYVDTLICDEDELSVMFSFTRSYFFVDTAYPGALVDYLSLLLPNKKLSELYASIGLHKHGKTEFYRGFVEHIENSSDEFIIAPGIKGMVMAVFTLPSYQTVFKVIKDRFAPQKNTTPDEVKAKYHVVKTHDRVGRMADTQEFQNFSFPRDRFSPDLLQELRAVCASSLVEENDRIIIRHLYTERHMTPLNLYIEDCTDEELRNALDEYGNAITQLAAANIFPGDMLLKNFGITRHGRVVFYDYDEISYMTEMNFRDSPEAQTPEQEMSTEPEQPIAPNDVFPEGFRGFLPDKRDIKQRFTELHGDLFEASFWQQLKDNVSEGEVSDVFPYRRKKRFAARR